MAGVERDPLDLDLDTATTSSLGQPRVSLQLSRSRLGSETSKSSPSSKLIRAPFRAQFTRRDPQGKAPIQPTTHNPEPREIRLRAQQLHLRAQGAGSTPISGPSPCSAHHFLPEVAIRQTLPKGPSILAGLSILSPHARHHIPAALEHDRRSTCSRHKYQGGAHCRPMLLKCPFPTLAPAQHPQTYSQCKPNNTRQPCTWAIHNNPMATNAAPPR